MVFRISPSSLSLWVSLGAILSSAADVKYQLNIVNANVAPDGFTRMGVLSNGGFPGTLIQANKNDVLRLNVSNQLTDARMRRSVSIHWHGLFQARTASEDGPAFATQCPISPGHSYQYDIPLNGQSGTFWYHSHLSTQYVDGVRGPIVIYDPNDPQKSLYDVDDKSTVITLDDWYHGFAPALQAMYFSAANSNGQEPVPDAGLINGKGRYIGGPATPWSVINVTKGKRYRMRLINMSAFARYDFSVQGHSMTIIEADGIAHQPLKVDSLTIFPAQRYSFVLTADQAVSNYWISAPMTVAGSSSNKNLDTRDIAAILRYAGAAVADPGGTPSSFAATFAGTTATDPAASTSVKGGSTKLSENNLKPLINPGAPGGSAPADRVIDLDFTKTKDGNNIVEWTINGIKYLPPSLPTLLNIIANNYTVESDFTPSEHTFVLTNNTVTELRIHGSLNGIIHPFHLHGHAFDVIQSSDGGGTNYVDPPRRDVVGVGGSGVIIRFRTDSPGPWFLHCHIDWHLEAGLAVVFAEAPQQQRTGAQSQIIKDTWRNLCKVYQALPADQQ